MGVDRRVDRGTNPPILLELGGQSMLCPPYFLKRICVSFCSCVYCNFCSNCHLAKLYINHMLRVQHVTESTQREGGWLDVIITRDDCALSDISIHPPTISDHGLVLATIPFLSDAPSNFIGRVRDWRRLDREAFKAALF